MEISTRSAEWKQRLKLTVGMATWLHTYLATQKISYS